MTDSNKGEVFPEDSQVKRSCGGNPWNLPQKLPRAYDAESDDFTVEEALEELAALGFVAGDMVPHLALLCVCQRLLGYYDVCSAFGEHMNVAVQKVNGGRAESYPFDVAMKIIGYYLRSWGGCPYMVCEGGIDYSELTFN